MSTTEPENNSDDSMRAMPEDKYGEESRGARRGFPVKPLLLVVVVVVALVLLFYPGGEPEVPAPEPEAPPVVSAPAPPPAEDIPPREVTPVEEPEEPNAVAAPVPAEPPLPEPGDSDPLMREQLQEVGAGGELQGFTEGEHLLDRLVALVDGGSRGVLLRKILPMKAPDEPFPVEEVGDQLFMDPAGYDRYDSYVDSVVALDTATIVNSFHTLRPLYEKAYAQLGLPAGDLDNAVIGSLDRIIAAPELGEPVELRHDSVMYSFADPQLEELSPLQKQLLRMGPENTRRLKEKAREIRAGLLNP